MKKVFVFVLLCGAASRSLCLALLLDKPVRVNLNGENFVALYNVKTAHQRGATCGPCAIITAASIIATQLSDCMIANPARWDGKELPSVHYFDEHIKAMQSFGVCVQNSDISDLLIWWYQSRPLFKADGGQRVSVDELYEFKNALGADCSEAWAPRMTVVDCKGNMQFGNATLEDVIFKMWGRRDLERSPYAFLVVVNTGTQGIGGNGGSHWFPLVVIHYASGQREYFVSDSLGSNHSLDTPISGHGSISVHDMVRSIERGILRKEIEIE